MDAAVLRIARIGGADMAVVTVEHRTDHTRAGTVACVLRTNVAVVGTRRARAGGNTHRWRTGTRIAGFDRAGWITSVERGQVAVITLLTGIYRTVPTTARDT